jgi:hypothetical protein
MSLSISFAQWSNDPYAHIGHFGNFNWDDTGVCSDGLGGVFCALNLNGGIDWITHVDADGYLTLDNAVYPGILPMDSIHFGDTGPGATLIPSEPPGTVIVLSIRDSINDLQEIEYLGMVISKFDTSGRTGFGRIFIPSDTNMYFADRGTEGLTDFQGGYAGTSDHHGGVHLVFHVNAIGRVYNHLNSVGIWRYPLPGVLMRGQFLHADGTGGVIDTWYNFPNHPNEMRGQRYNAVGDSVWESGGRLMLPPPLGTGMLYALGSNRILCRTGDAPEQRLFLLDSNAVNLWEPAGRPFPTTTPNRLFFLDRLGGFFTTGPVVNGNWLTYHYNSDAQLIATSQPSNHNPFQADGLGGGYNYLSHDGYQDSLNAGWIWRWQSDLLLAWPDSLLAFSCSSCGSVRWTTVEGGGMVGILGVSTGIAFYHVNPDGTLGPSTHVELPLIAKPTSLCITSVYPNPFNATAKISFTLPKTASVDLNVYDVTGRKTGGLLSGPTGVVAAGEHRMEFDGSDLPSGIYFVRLEAGGISQTKKIVLLK